jgi:hypothetical protein
MTDLTKIEKLAAEIAICAPERQGTYSRGALVPWETILEIRAELDALGIDWKAAKAKMNAIVEARRSPNRELSK